jgi:hypothetical protein
MQIKRRSKSPESPGSAASSACLESSHRAEPKAARDDDPETRDYRMVSVMLNFPNGPSDMVLACINIV